MSKFNQSSLDIRCETFRHLYPGSKFNSKPDVCNLKSRFILEDKQFFGHPKSKARLGAVSKQWVKIGDLSRSRSDHGAIFVDNHFLIVGGESRGVGGTLGAVQTDKCSFTENGQISCDSQAPTLLHYRQYPELFLVNDQFCSSSFE